MRAGFTLVELLIAAVLTTLLSVGIFSLLGGGNQLFTRGLQVAHGRQASLLFFETFEDDVAACLVVPGHDKEPVAISEDGRRLAFYRTNRKASTLQVTVGSAVDYKIEKGNPVRNGIAMKQVAIEDWKFSLVAPDGKQQKAWLLATEAKFPEGGLTNRIVTVRRLVELVQPSSLARYNSPLFVADITPLSFVFLEAPKDVKKLLATADLGPGVGPAPVTTATTGVAL